MTNEHDAPDDTVITFTQFMWYVLEAFPLATVDEDDDGQLVVNTGLRTIDVYVARMED